MFKNKKVLLLNDTSGGYHWGCTGACGYIKNQILKKNPKNFSSIPVDKIRGGICPPMNVKDFEECFSDFQIKNNDIIKQIVKSDLIIINGEGTIHGFTNAPRVLLYLMHVAKRRFNKKVLLIAASIFPESNHKDIVNFYKTCLINCEYIAVRDKASHNFVSGLGIKSELAFDCLPLAIRSLKDRNYQVVGFNFKRKYICISGGVIFDYSKIKHIAFCLRFFYPKSNFVFITGRLPNCIKSDNDINVYNEMKKYMPNLQLFWANTFEDWFSVISNSYLLLSGRFHYTVAKMAGGGGI